MLSGGAQKNMDLVRGKYGGGLLECGGECVFVEAGGLPDAVEVGQEVFGRHVAGEVVFGHGAAAVAFDGAVEAAAAMLVGGVYFFAPGGGGGMKVGADFEGGVGRDELAKEVGYAGGGGDAYGVGELEDADAKAAEHFYPAHDNLGVPGVAVGVAEAHAHVEYEFFVGGLAEVLNLFYAFERLFYGGVGVAQLEGFGYGEGVA